MASGTCISGEGHGTLPVSRVVQIVIVVQHPQRIQPFDLADASGLPVDPPEVYAFFFGRVEDVPEACIEKIWI